MHSSRNYPPDFYTPVRIICKNLLRHSSRNYHPDYHTIVWIIYKNLFIHRSRNYHPDYHTISRIIYKNLFIHRSRIFFLDYHIFTQIIYKNLFPPENLPNKLQSDSIWHLPNRYGACGPGKNCELSNVGFELIAPYLSLSQSKKYLIFRGNFDKYKSNFFLQAVKVNIWDTAGQEEFENLRT